MTRQRTLVVGIGSPHGDDQVGWLVAERLQHELPAGTDLRRASAPGQLLDWLSDVDRLYVCDACDAMGGELKQQSSTHTHRWEWPAPVGMPVRSSGSHSFGLPQALGLAERLGTLPDSVVIYGIPGRRFEAFAELSPELCRLLPDIAVEIARDILSSLPPAALEQVGHA